MFNVFRKKVFALFKYKLILQQLFFSSDLHWFIKKGAEIFTLADTKWIGDKKMATCIVKTVFSKILTQSFISSPTKSVYNFMSNR